MTTVMNYKGKQVQIDEWEEELSSGVCRGSAIADGKSSRRR